MKTQKQEILDLICERLDTKKEQKEILKDSREQSLTQMIELDKEIFKINEEIHQIEEVLTSLVKNIQ